MPKDKVVYNLEPLAYLRTRYMALLQYTNKGLYCEQAGIYIDPHKKVNYALITHGHADHSRWGHKHYLCTETSGPILRHRLGPEMNIETIPYGKEVTINNVKFSFHPAGHITGSAMIRAEYQGEIWVVTGDYKVEDDGLAEAYEPVKCHHFITECTFGLPVYRWRPQEEIMTEINDWWRANAAEGKSSLISAYSLGKAQRLINSVDNSIGPILTHGAIDKMNTVYRDMGIALPPTSLMDKNISKNDLKSALVIAPPAAISSNWSRKLKGYSLAIASGWMAIRGHRRRKGADRGFVLSDHCDWPGLLQAIEESGAEHIYPTHGNTETFSRYLREQGYNATPLEGAGAVESIDSGDL